MSKGLLKLMVRLPALRSELQRRHAHEQALRDLCDAYDEATHVLALMRNNPHPDREIIADYESVCGGIEGEVIELCSARRSSV
ncbi:hypothetical protein JJB09_07530 [Rhizobium sp. KVB221]|uniref:Nodulation protein n=1 Tax=Rhizobium setariae TaxID=2801340 RepID=A0A936YKE8_9HYPH|nr:hypothetical protein [Rhizobium setariae]MBL0371878.1 hypothetical protein [Rhizobium setariae]